MLTGIQTSAVLLSARAFAAPTPTPSSGGSATPSPGTTPSPGATPSTGATGVPSPGSLPTKDKCDLIVGPARDYCQSGQSTSKTPPDPTAALDPAAALAKGCAEAATWIIQKLSDAVRNTSNVDFTNGTFLRQYAVVFAASTILTLVLWLLAVAKRAVRGVPFTEAITEAVGFLWLTVLASAFTPLILYTVVQATDAVTEVIASGTGDHNDTFFGGFAEALKKGDGIGGGPIMLIVISLVSVLAAGVLWLELVIRAALLYVGALLGTAVYSGLVDKNMWGHVRRWAGIMIAVILVKPIIVIVLSLAGALSSGQGPNALSAVVSGLAIIILAIFASAMIYRFVPGFGDEIISSRNASKDAASRQAAAVISSPATLVKQGITTHSSRGGGAPAPQQGAARPANPLSGGVAAHSARRPPAGAPGPTGTGSAPSGSPAPRAQNNGNTTGGERS
ncbi:membrane protein [Streptomyces caatingaensis]|uniref:Membrane protein n=1 Tax=Streptomyces caatingaensis TaxID=1678637 RepID=A0A0K9XET6_9ACTN|nr:membrane protein [Streptomyces caatingaensis]